MNRIRQVLRWGMVAGVSIVPLTLGFISGVVYSVIQVAAAAFGEGIDAGRRLIHG